MKRSSLALGLVLLVSFTFIASAQVVPIHASFVTWYVSPSVVAAPPHSCSNPDFNTIQTAINAAGSGDTVIVCAGTYTEQIGVNNKAVKIQGAGSSVTKLVAPDPLTADVLTSHSIVRIFGAPSFPSPLVEISGMNITGPGPSSCGSITAGILVAMNGNAWIHDNVINAIRDNPASGCQNGIGILVGRNAWSTVGVANITHNVIRGYQKAAIVVDGVISGSQSYAIIANNTIYASAASNQTIAANSVQISRNAIAIVMDNQITGNMWCGSQQAGDYGTAVLLYQAWQVSVLRNDIFGPTDVGIYEDMLAGGEANVVNNTLTQIGASCNQGGFNIGIWNVAGNSVINANNQIVGFLSPNSGVTTTTTSTSTSVTVTTSVSTSQSVTTRVSTIQTTTALSTTTSWATSISTAISSVISTFLATTTAFSTASSSTVVISTSTSTTTTFTTSPITDLAGTITTPFVIIMILVFMFLGLGVGALVMRVVGSSGRGPAEVQMSYQQKVDYLNTQLSTGGITKPQYDTYLAEVKRQYRVA